MKQPDTTHELYTAIAQLKKSILAPEEKDAAIDLPPTIGSLQSLLGLNTFEAHIILLCTAMELDSELAKAVSTQTAFVSPSDVSAISFGFALSHLKNPDWQSTTPQSPLRRWRIIDCKRQNGTLNSPLQLDERIFYYILGINQPDERLAPYLKPVANGCWLPPELHTKASALANKLISESKNNSLLPALVLTDARHGDTDALASFISDHLKSPLYRLNALPQNQEEKETLRLLWLRETILMKSGLICPSPETQGEVSQDYSAMAESCAGPVFIDGDPLPLRHRRQWVVPLGALSVSDQQAVWQKHLGKNGFEFNDEFGQIIEHFNFGLVRMEHTALDTQSAIKSGIPPKKALWNSARNCARPSFSSLAQKITPKASWHHLILPDTSRQTLENLTATVRQRYKVYNSWGFIKRDSRGLGISALLHGPSGTGKTMAAEVIAKDLQLDLYRIDLSAVVNKYIGETEKNLKQVFDAAEEGGAILLFDEADTLFGKRSEVRDSHDRYANIEVGYLLQKMESFHGLAILTTNLKSSFDDSFLRRLRYVVEFPFPSYELRKAIWETIFPKETPLDGINYNRLARLTIPGGNIRNIALGAAFIAADEDKSVSMDHVFRSAQIEYTKLDRPLTSAETAGWKI
ncbi:MAG: ATP-binding protein [Desulfobacterales bacterium]|nr:ATP-binding protein [Desulfobacterales bacterium]